MIATYLGRAAMIALMGSAYAMIVWQALRIDF